MFGLIKLAMYALMGYVLYEMYQGMTQESGGSSFGGGGSRRGGGHGGGFGGALGDDAGRMGTLTGPGRGTTVSANDADGGEMRHTVGRGVVSR